MTLQKHFQLAKLLTKLLDTQFEVLGIKFGLDPILGFIPNFGNWLTTLISLYLFWLAWKLRVPHWVYGQMLLTILFDFALTSIPFIGNFFDIFWHANEKNLKLLNRFNSNEVLEGKVI